MTNATLEEKQISTAGSMWPVHDENEWKELWTNHDGENDWIRQEYSLAAAVSDQVEHALVIRRQWMTEMGLDDVEIDAACQRSEEPISLDAEIKQLEAVRELQRVNRGETSYK